GASANAGAGARDGGLVARVGRGTDRRRRCALPDLPAHGEAGPPGPERGLALRGRRLRGEGAPGVLRAGARVRRLRRLPVRAQADALRAHALWRRPRGDRPGGDPGARRRLPAHAMIKPASPTTSVKAKIALGVSTATLAYASSLALQRV